MQEAPDSEFTADALLSLAELAYKQGDFSQTEKYTQSLEGRKVAKELWPAALYLHAMACIKQKKSEPARAALAKLVDNFPQDRAVTGSLFWLAELDFNEGKSDDALRRYDQLLARPDADKYHANAELRVAQTLLQKKQWKEAFARADAFLAKNPEPGLKGEALYVQARALQQQAKFDEARKKYGEVIGPERTELAAKAQFMIGETYFHERNYAEALKAFLKVEILYAYPEWQELALYEIGQCHEQMKELEQAVDAYKRLIEQFPKSELVGKARDRLANMKR